MTSTSHIAAEPLRQALPKLEFPVADVCQSFDLQHAHYGWHMSDQQF